MFWPLVINGDVWQVLSVAPADGRLIDRTGAMRLATTDPETKTICIRDDLRGALLDRVLLHEASHAAMVSHGMLDGLRSALPPDYWVYVEEWACNLLANHGREIIQAVNAAMPRNVTIGG